jgi:hypothetical protein
MNSTAPAPLCGLVLFPDPGLLPFTCVSSVPGVTVLPPTNDAVWRATMSVDGLAVTIEPVERFERFPEVLLQHEPRLTEEDRALVRVGRSAVRVISSALPTSDPFEVRKSLARILGKLLGENGAAAIDSVAQRVWTRDELDDELAHDAPLHIDQMYTLHAVTPDGEQTCSWLHSHGLEELGAFDFDVLRPHRSHVADRAGIVRAAALASIEGRLRPGGEPLRLTNLELPVSAVAVEEFMSDGTAADRRLRSADDHSGRRMVLCDPKSGWGWWSKRPPSRLFQVEPPDGTLVFLSVAASQLAARRARGTYGRLRALANEFASLELPVLVKLAYEADRGGESREYLWFTVDAFSDDAVEATLVNAPHGIARMQKGERGTHAIERLNDWVIVTPVGSIQPHSLFNARALRSEQGKLEKMLAERKERDARGAANA